MFNNLLFYCCLFFLGTSLSANAQSTALPDSMSTYVSLINECLKQDASEKPQQNIPVTLVQFMNELRLRKNKLTQPELNYLAYAYRGFLHSREENYSNALTDFEHGRRFLAKARPYDPLLGHLYLLRAEVLLKIGDKKRGLQSLEDAAEVYALKNDRSSLNIVYLKQSDFYLENNEVEKAILPLNKSIKASRKETEIKINSLIKRGQLYSMLKQFDQADQDFKSAEEILNPKDSKAIGELQAARGRHFLRQEKPGEALALYDEALERLCPGIRAEKFAAFKNCNNPAAFLETLKSRGDILTQSITEDSKESALKNLYNNNITGIRFLQHLQSSESPGLLESEIKAQLDFFLEQGIQTCLSLHELESENQIYFQNALNLAELRKQSDGIKPIQVSEIQQLAKKENQSYLSFFYGQHNFYSFLIHPSGLQFQRIEKDNLIEEELLLLIDYHHKPLQSVKDITLFKELSHSFYQSLFENLEITTDKLVIIPDGLLAFVPFESFVSSLNKGDSHPLDYLLFHKQITYARSFAQLQRDLNKAPLNTRSVFTFAPMAFKKHGLIPLKGTPGHIRFLEDKFRSKKWINDEVTVSNFSSIWPNIEYNMVVFNTHATIKKTADIVFHDEYIPVEKFPQLNANMVILNSCYTFVEYPVKSKSSLNISNSFSQKGIPSTIAPMWAVQHQKTVQLMELFYLNLASGMEKGQAMTSAKIDYLKSCGNDAIACSPHFWAGTILTGNTQPLYKKSFLLPLIILVLLILLGFAWKRSQLEIG